MWDEGGNGEAGGKGVIGSLGRSIFVAAVIMPLKPV